jgi:hypothetical protein
MTKPDRDTVLAALTPDAVAAHYSITGTWRGRWMRSIRCAQDDHSSEAFGISRQGYWHCHSCDKGGDLLALVAAGERLDVRADFPAVLAKAAEIAGVAADDPWDPRPPPKARPPLPQLPPLHERVALAQKRAAWVWGRLALSTMVARRRADGRVRSPGELYLEDRHIDLAAISSRDELRESPLRVTPEQAMRSPEMKTLAYTFSVPGVALAVRNVDTGALVDVRIRRLEPRPDQPKIIGMLGGITSAAAEPGRPRQLVGCYGHPHDMPRPMTVLVEGFADYLTALCLWPAAWVLGAVEAGTMGLLAAHAARRIAREDRQGDHRLLIVEQVDPEKVRPDGTVRVGAADASINEDPNAAAKAAIRILGAKRVGWLFCEHDVAPSAVKDLNDLVRTRGADAARNHVRWWSDV